jgi:hypothetical protein
MIPKSGRRFSDKIMRKSDIKFAGMKAGTAVQPNAYV